MKIILLFLAAGLTTCFGQLARPKTEIFTFSTNTFIAVPTNKVIRITVPGQISGWYVDNHPVDRQPVGSPSVFAGPCKQYFDGGLVNYEIVRSTAKTLWLGYDPQTITVPRGKSLKVLDTQNLIEVTVQNNPTNVVTVNEDFYSKSTQWVGPVTIQITGLPLDPGVHGQGYVTYVIGTPAVRNGQ